MKHIWKLVIAILVCEAAGAIGGLATASSVRTWYATLAKPPFNPPAWIFGPVWTALYALMGVAAWLVWRKGLGAGGVRPALALFGVQLLLNVAWSFIFFGLHSPMYAFFELILLWLAILATAFAFAKVAPLAAILLVPYILWVSFAGVLNFYIWILNR